MCLSEFTPDIGQVDEFGGNTHTLALTHFQIAQLMSHSLN